MSDGEKKQRPFVDATWGKTDEIFNPDCGKKFSGKARLIHK